MTAEPEPYVEPAPRVVHSRLMKSDYLIRGSQLFPILVSGACAYEGVSYSQAVLEHCATRPEILDHLELTTETVLDEILAEFGYNEAQAHAMDLLIVQAVQQYKQQGE